MDAGVVGRMQGWLATNQILRLLVVIIIPVELENLNFRGTDSGLVKCKIHFFEIDGESQFMRHGALENNQLYW